VRKKIAVITRRNRSARGFSLLELVITVAIGLTLTATAIPMIRSSVANYKLKSATNSITGVIQSTRYRAIYSGFPYRVTFTKSTSSYQVTKKAPSDTSFVNVNSVVPFGDVATTIEQDTEFEFSPGGSVKKNTGAYSFKVSYSGQQMQVDVTAYGNITIKKL
jgi:prepilin-type N-terminal cleavage/methylation domain-containing protein